MSPSELRAAVPWLEGGGRMGERIRSFEWSRHPLGPPARWPESLKTVIRILLASRYAMWLAWGPEYYFFCNDAYLPTLGIKRDTLGASARKVWAEIWPDIGPLIDSVMKTGQATWNESLRLFLERSGYPEETYHTFSYSPAPDDAGGVGGMLCVVTEETERVLGERRLAFLRELGADLSAAGTEGDLWRAVERRAGSRPEDLPLALVYLLDAHGGAATLAASHGASPGDPAAPATLEAGEEGAVWPVSSILASAGPLVLDGAAEHLANLSGRPWKVPPRQAVALPLISQGGARPAGFLAAGLNPFRPFDSSYRGFLELLVGQVSAALQNVRARDEERRRLNALAELDRAKTHFFTNVSHELRTPLTLLLGPIEDTLSGDPGALGAADRERLEIALRNALRLQKLTNTLLEFSRIEAGRVQATFEPLDLSQLTSDLASAFGSAAEQAGIRYEIDCPPLPVPVWVDRGMWEKIVLNLLSNSFKFTFEGGIAVTLRATEGRAVLEVKDTGTGIPESEMPRLFERFHRVENARARTHEGSGIGLALVQELTRLHGGTVRARSELGKGTTFTVSIPLGHAHLPPERVARARETGSTRVAAHAYVEEALRWLPGEAEELLPEELPAREAAPERKSGEPPARVLLADDNLDMRDYLARLLRTRWEVEAVPNGRLALEAARRHPPDLVLSDIMMPELDGFGLLRELRADPSLGTVPVILLSARAGEESSAEGLREGADDYLVKPFSRRELLARVDAHLRLSRLRKESEERFRTMANVSPVLIWVTDTKGAVEFVNRAYLEFFGVTAEELKGPAGWQPLVHPEDAPAYAGAFSEGLARQKPFRSQARVRRADGEWRWISSYAAPRFGPSGEFLGMVGTSPDITEMKEFQKNLEHQVEKRTHELSQALREVETFSYTVAHDLRAPLRSMSQLAEILMEDFAPRLGEEGMQYARRIGQAAERMDHLTSDLLEYSRLARGEIKSEPLEVKSVVRDILLTLEADARRTGADIRDEVGGEVVIGSRFLLTQALTNLLSNALKFTKPGVPPEVRLRSGPAARGRIRIWVEDRGIGIAPEHMGKLFQLFERLNPRGPYEGNGVGLAIVRKAAQRMGGDAGVESTSGEGSRFYLELPGEPAW